MGRDRGPASALEQALLLETTTDERRTWTMAWSNVVIDIGHVVFTHLPSSILLMLAPLAPTGSIAAALFLAREALVEMDVPTRQSYVMAVVHRSSRTYASGMTNVARNAGWAVGPLVGGMAMQHLALAAPLLIGGTLKISYDLALYRSFRHLRPPEEQVPLTTTSLQCGV
jgi:predicted MFS family arabinose efflux permease